MNTVLLEWRPYTSLFQRNSLGLQYIAATLRQNGYKTHIQVFEGEAVEEVCRQVLQLKPDIVAIPIYPEIKDTVYAIFDHIKESDPNITTISGGHTATLYAAKIMKEQKNIDLITCGESEEIYLELCRNIEKKQSIENVKGIFYRKNNLILKTGPREQIKDLNVLPFPVDDITKDLNDDTSPTVFTSISSSRGCLGNCDFCVSHRVSKIVKNAKWRGRDPESIIEEIKCIISNFPGKRIAIEFVDSSFEDPDPRNKSRILKFVDLLESNDIKIAFSFLTRAESWSEKDTDLIKRMRKCGLFRVSPGFESGSEASLISFGKRASVENNYKAYEVFSKNGVDVCGLIIMFHPYVTFNDLRNNAKFIVDIGLGHRPQSWLHSLYVFPDTRIFHRIAMDGLLIGTDKSQFVYLYSFNDGRMEKLYKTVERLKRLPVVDDFENTCEKISYELKLYEVWKEQYDEFEKVRDIMDEYINSFKKTSKIVSERLNEMFLELVELAEARKILHKEEKIIEEWNHLLEEKHNYLESEWVRFRVKLLRKGIRLI
ncbi:B12-binding domain-containing radical SAM protein [Acetivibrio mesophilus]|uniref:B12-binding domain-containing radical SAM protein n=1 Tax=Acetivibrio mesophilus TaxID=2487273 RepID=UPI000840ABB9|nr:radical SAM protein [Acetivibrio mesophilus]ODM26247.1 hypothetical protein A7W90_08420 [Clostridium sp. Bc-iso-3]HHV28113.1 radical SAM protein [Clostridium sp.]